LSIGRAVNKIALVAAAILASIWVIMWLDLPPVLNAPLPASQKVVVVIGLKEQRPIIFSSQVIQSVPDPELATVKDITSTRLNARSNLSKSIDIEQPGWLRIIKKSGMEKVTQRVKFVTVQEIAKFPKLIEAIALADLKSSNRMFSTYEKPGHLTETLEVDASQAKDIIAFMEGKKEVSEGKQYSWTIMFGMSIYTIQMTVSQSAPVW